MTDPRRDSSGDIPRRKICGAETRQHTDCGRPAGWGTDHVGFGNCKLHGGSTGTGKKHGQELRQAAWDRILDNIDPMLTKLLELATTAESEPVQLGAVKDWLDRAGLGPKYVHEHTGPGGGPIPVEVRAEGLLERAKAMAAPAPKVTRKKAPAKAKKETE